MAAVFAVLVLSCGLLGADILGLLIDYRSTEPVGDLASHADLAPPSAEERQAYELSSGRAKGTIAPSASPAAAAKSSQPAEAIPSSSSEDSSSSAAAAELSAPPSQANLTTALETNGSPAAQAASPPPAAHSSENFKENRDMTLQGIMLGDSAGIAVLEYGGNTYTVGQGDNVGDYHIEDIQADRVTLNRQGQRSQVHINTPASSASSASAVSASAISDGNATPAAAVGNYPPVLPPPNEVPLPPQPVSLPEAQETSGSTTSNVSTDAVYNITEADFTEGVNISPEANELTREELDEFTRKGAALLADIRGSEVENGRGIQVEFRNPDNALAKLGMKSGDVVLRINSKNVLGVEDIYNAVLTMRDAPQIDIEITRNGQPLSLFHRFPDR